jgi:RNA polymerase sigma-70 factor (ECF subfamily)
MPRAQRQRHQGDTAASNRNAVAFKRELTGVIPHLRAFARGLCVPIWPTISCRKPCSRPGPRRNGSTGHVDAWTFVILRNAYLTDMRRNRFRGI